MKRGIREERLQEARPDHARRRLLETDSGAGLPVGAHSETRRARLRDVATGVQVADLVASIVSWNVRFAGLVLGRRDELDPYAQQVRDLAPSVPTVREGAPFTIYPFAVIDDLRSRSDQERA